MFIIETITFSDIAIAIGVCVELVLAYVFIGIYLSHMRPQMFPKEDETSQS